MKLKEGVEDFLIHCQYERNVTQKTLKAYQTDLNQLTGLIDVDGTVRVCAIDKDTVRAFLCYLSEKFKPRSVKRKVATLRAFFSYLEYEDHINVSPLRKMKVRVKTAQELPRTIKPRDVKRLLIYSYQRVIEMECKNNAMKTFMAKRDLVIIEMLFATGMRVSELACLKWEDIDTAGGAVRVMGKGDKERIIPLCSDEVARAIIDYRNYVNRVCKNTENFLVNRSGNGISAQSIRLTLSKVAESAGINARITPHMFRHTAATLLRKNGMDVHDIQHFLGHSSIQTTMIYTHVDLLAHRREVRKRHPRRAMIVSPIRN